MILQALPMCAPYSALLGGGSAGAALRVKLTPGTGKRGRVAKAAVELILRGGGGGASGGGGRRGDAEPPSSTFPRVRELIRLAPDADCAAVVPGGGAKVSAPGAAKLAAEARKAKGGRKKKSIGGGGGGK